MTMALHRDAAVTTPRAATRPVYPVTEMRTHPLAMARAHEIATTALAEYGVRVVPVDPMTAMILNYAGQTWPVPRKPRKPRKART
jgi:hypothetical protein